jgi:pimeloyl-ACP methyl ester carboxylesterase
MTNIDRNRRALLRAGAAIIAASHLPFVAAATRRSNDGDFTLSAARTGTPLVLMPYLSDAQGDFRYQEKGLGSSYRVVKFAGGCGEQLGASGDRRLARDLHDALVAGQLDRIVLTAHGPACRVSLRYLETFGRGRIAKLILVDPALERASDGNQTSRLLTSVPTLIVGGKGSTVVGWRSLVALHEQTPGSQMVVFEKEEGGGHCMFQENPEKFNQVIREFVG